MVKANEILKSVKEISDFLITTKEESNIKLASQLMSIMDNEPTKNYINFNEAFLTIASFGNFELAKKCMDIAEYEIFLESGCLWERSHYAFVTTAVELAKGAILSSGSKPTLKNKYLYVLEFTNGTVKIGITKEKEKRMKAISSASGMDITRSYFTEKIDNVQHLETALHRHFKRNRLNGEFFNIDFDTAVREVKKRTDNTN